MAKYNDDDDDFGLHEDIPSGIKISDKDSDSKPAKGLAALWAKLPIVPVLEGIQDFFANLSVSIRALFADKEKPMLPFALLGGVVMVLLTLAILLIVALGGALSGNPDQVAKKNGVEQPASKADKSAPSKKDATAKAEVPTTERGMGNDLGVRDPFLSKPILLDEPAFMAQGEIRYQRQPQENWALSDIAPGWQDLGKVYRTILRENNRAEFYRMLGESPPPLDRY